jgi:hypothetical protein
MLDEGDIHVINVNSVDPRSNIFLVSIAIG